MDPVNRLLVRIFMKLRIRDKTKSRLYADDFKLLIIIKNESGDMSSRLLQYFRNSSNFNLLSSFSEFIIS